MTGPACPVRPADQATAYALATSERWCGPARRRAMARTWRHPRPNPAARLGRFALSLFTLLTMPGVAAVVAALAITPRVRMDVARIVAAVRRAAHAVPVELRPVIRRALASARTTTAPPCVRPRTAVTV